MALALDVPEDQLILSGHRRAESEGSVALDKEIERSKAKIAELAGTSPDQMEIILKKQ